MRCILARSELRNIFDLVGTAVVDTEAVAIPAVTGITNLRVFEIVRGI